jgi:hypothetical protein
MPLDIPIAGFAGRASPVIAVFAAGYLATVGTVLFGALLFDLLAPFFGGRRNARAALTLAAYAATPVLIASITLVNPSLTPILALAAFHSGYLCYLGLPALALVPRSEAAVCVGITVIVSLVASQVLGYLAGALPDVLAGG